MLKNRVCPQRVGPVEGPTDEPCCPGAGPGITPVGGPILGLLGTVPGVAVVPGPTPEVDGEVEVARPPPGVPVLAAPPAAPPALPALLAPPPGSPASPAASLGKGERGVREKQYGGKG